MGEYADMILNGDVDMYTGEYLGEGDGYPRSDHGDRYYQRRRKYKYTIRELQEMTNESLGNLIKSKAKFGREKLHHYELRGKVRIDIRTFRNDVKKLILSKERQRKKQLELKNKNNG